MNRLIWSTLAVVLALLASPAWAQKAEPQAPPRSQAAPFEVQPVSPRVTIPVWAERPTAADYMRYYPREAFERGVSGRAVLDCIVAAAGHLDCTVVEETPEGHAFGEAALRVSRHFRMAPTTREGEPTLGGRTRIPIRFNVSSRR
ncbi:TonB family protein [Terricaulis sp.]|uniref:TonB family protein n=1 Tax=Terricaulis sp. TaxID=2768686 RepID=UPI003784A515